MTKENNWCWFRRKKTKGVWGLIYVQLMESKVVKGYGLSPDESRFWEQNFLLDLKHYDLKLRDDDRNSQYSVWVADALVLGEATRRGINPGVPVKNEKAAYAIRCPEWGGIISNDNGLTDDGIFQIGGLYVMQEGVWDTVAGVEDLQGHEKKKPSVKIPDEFRKHSSDEIMEEVRNMMKPYTEHVPTKDMTPKKPTFQDVALGVYGILVKERKDLGFDELMAHTMNTASAIMDPEGFFQKQDALAEILRKGETKSE